jgi:hypothetical protein
MPKSSSAAAIGADEDVRRLEIAVHDALLVRGGHGVEHLAEEPTRSGTASWCEWACASKCSPSTYSWAMNQIPSGLRPPS